MKIPNKLDLAYFLFNEVVDRDEYRLRAYNRLPIRNIIDIGANVGMFSVMARFMFPRARIFAFEPGEEAFHYLEQNTENLQVVKVNAALSDGRPLYFKDVDKECSNKTIAANRCETSGDAAVAVKVVTLRQIVDSFEIDLSELTYLKVDAEGGEAYLNNPEALAICRKMSHIFIEVHPWLLPFDFSTWIDAMKDTHDVFKPLDIDSANVHGFVRRDVASQRLG